MSLFSWIRPGVPSGTREIDHTLHRERGRCTSRQGTRSLEIAYESAESWPAPGTGSEGPELGRGPQKTQPNSRARGETA